MFTDPKTTPIEGPKPVNRATTPTQAFLKWVEPKAVDEVALDFIPEVRNNNDYFDDLQHAVSGLAALLNSDLTDEEILTKAAMEVNKIDPQSYEVVREYLGEDVTDKMKRIHNDLDELAALVAGIEASLASFSPLAEAEEKEEESTRAIA